MYMYIGASGKNSEGFWERTYAYVQDVHQTQGLHITLYLALVGILYFAYISSSEILCIMSAEISISEKRNEVKDSKKMKKNEKKKTEKKVVSENIQNQEKSRKDTDVTVTSPLAVDNLSTFESKINQDEVKFTPLILVLIYIFYFIIFHNLANLPLGDKLLFGVHQRFWMQPNVLLFIIAGVGFDILSKLLKNFCVYVWENIFLIKNGIKNEKNGNVITKKYSKLNFIVNVLTNLIAIVIVTQQLEKWYFIYAFVNVYAYDMYKFIYKYFVYIHIYIYRYR
jgi:hypothetical protein